jgi:hypothetical protein
VVRRTRAIAITALLSTIAGAKAAQAAPIGAPSSQIFPKIAAGAGGFLAVWEDSRNGPSDIYGTRLTETGAILDATGIPVSTDVAIESRADVAFFGGTYLVVWQSGDDGDHDVWARTVATNGVPGPAFVVAGGPGDQGTPVIACGTSRCVVAYVDNAAGSYDVYARAVAPAGAAGAALDVSGAPNTAELGPVIVARGDDYYVAWQDERLGPSIVVFGAPITDGGALAAAGTPVILASGPTDRPSGVATDGTSVLVAWTRGVDYPMALFARRAPWSGLPTEPEFQLAASGDNSDRSGMAFDGANYLVTWQDLDTDEVVGRRVRPDGTLVDGGAVRLSDGSSQPDFNTGLAFADGRYALVWDDLRLGTDDIFGTTFDASLAPASSGDAIVSRVFGNAVPATSPCGNLAALVALGAAGLTIFRRRR